MRMSQLVVALPFVLLGILLATLVASAHRQAASATAAPARQQVTRLAPIVVTATVAAAPATPSVFAGSGSRALASTGTPRQLVDNAFHMPYFSFECSDRLDYGF